MTQLVTQPSGIRAKFGNVSRVHGAAPVHTQTILSVAKAATRVVATFNFWNRYPILLDLGAHGCAPRERNGQVPGC